MAPLVAVLGASRFLGRLAIPLFAAEGWRVRALDRRQAAIAGMLGVERDWADPLDERSLTRATTDCTCVLDLSSSEGGPEAVAVAEAALLAGNAGRVIRVERLGAAVAAPAGDPARVTVVRCAPVIGAGSPWVVLLRALGDRLPVVPCPAWMRRATEPVAAADAVRALVWLAGADEPTPTATTWPARTARPTASCSPWSRAPTAGGRGWSTPASPATSSRASRSASPRAASPRSRPSPPRCPAPEAVARGDSLLRLADLPITPLASAIRAAAAGGRRRGI